MQSFLWLLLSVLHREVFSKGIRSFAIRACIYKRQKSCFKNCAFNYCALVGFLLPFIYLIKGMSDKGKFRKYCIQKSRVEDSTSELSSEHSVGSVGRAIGRSGVQFLNTYFPDTTFSEFSFL